MAEFLLLLIARDLKYQPTCEETNTALSALKKQKIKVNDQGIETNNPEKVTCFFPISFCDKKGSFNLKKCYRNPKIASITVKKINPEILEILTKILETNGTLATLNLSNCYITNIEIIKLSNFLMLCKTLKSLILCNNIISDEGAKKLADIVTRNETLETLNLRNNQISDAGVRELAEALEEDESLRTLDLGGNPMTLWGVSYLAKMLKKNKKLTRLILCGCQIDNVGAYALAEAIGMNETLKVLDLSDCKIRGNGALALIQAIKKKKFDHLGLGGNPISSDEMEKLKEFIM